MRWWCLLTLFGLALAQDYSVTYVLEGVTYTHDKTPKFKEML